MRDIKSFLGNLSHHSGIYQMLGKGGEVLYVGKAKDLKKRVTQYFSSRTKDLKTIALVKQVEDIDITITHSESEAVLLECNLIKQHQPRYNVLLRDDKSYPYILIATNHPYPCIDLYRGARKKDGLYFGPYPSASSVRETISLLQKLFGLRTCRDAYYESRTRPCLLYQIGRCTGSCAGLISKEDYAKHVEMAVLFLEGKSHKLVDALQARMEMASKALDFESAAQYRDQIARLRQIQERQYVSVARGDADILGLATQAGIMCLQLLSIRGGKLLDSRSYFPKVPSHSTEEEVIAAFLTQHYLSHPSHIDSIPKQIIIDKSPPEHRLVETALSELAKHKVTILQPTRGEKKKWLSMAVTSAKQSLAAHLLSKTNVKERGIALQTVLGLPRIPRRIECFDISHSRGEATVASCVVFDQSGPVKSDYRRFNIQNVTPGDDIGAMRQVIERRFKRLQKENAVLPDVVLIDGGTAQLAAGQQVLEKLNITEVMLVGVAKGALRKPGYETIHINHQMPIHLPGDSLALHFIQQIRDEAHRFAITGHRQRRDKTRRKSTLEEIPGVGSKRRRELLRYFGGIQGLAHASLDELRKVPGISHSLAERIFATLHDETL